jgi:hypothetical protein
MKNLLNQPFLCIFFLFSLLTLTVPMSAADAEYQCVAGTEFEPVSSADTYFFLKDFIKHSTCDKLQFIGDREKQDMVVCENTNGTVTLFNWDYKPTASRAFHRVEDDLFIHDEEYVVTTPKTIISVKGTSGNCGGDDNRIKTYNVVKSLDYADNYMLIARPMPCDNTVLLHYILDDVYAEEEYELEMACTNISDVTNVDMSIPLSCYVHYFMEDDFFNPIGNEQFDWNLNAPQSRMEQKLVRFTTKKDTKRIVVTITMESCPVYAVLGMDYIKINSKNVTRPKTTTPSITGQYNKCVTQTVQDVNFSDYFKVVEGTPAGTLRFYEDENLTKPVTTFKSAPVGKKTYYYTYQENGKDESDPAPFEVIVDGVVDFELKVSAPKVLAGNQETVVTIVPSGVAADSYTWELNGQKVLVDGMVYITNLYVDTKYVVTGSNHCDSKTKEAFVEVSWPTAFTPYNKNGMNETFAKGLPLAIYNRLGIQIFEGQNGWDGIMNKNMGANTMAVPGVYYYAVQLPNGEVKKGTIEIVKF